MSHGNFEKAAKNPFKSAGSFDLLNDVVGAKQANAINIALTLLNAKGYAVDEAPVVFDAYLSDDAAGVGITGTTASGGVAIGTNGVILASITASKYFKLVTNAAGRIDLTITHNATHTFYLTIVKPTGDLIVIPVAF